MALLDVRKEFWDDIRDLANKVKVKKKEIENTDSHLYIIISDLQRMAACSVYVFF